MKYNFDEVIDRKNTNALNTDGFRQYIFKSDQLMEFPYADDEFIRMWVADMEFATPPEIIEAIKIRLDKRIFGYTKVFDTSYFEAFAGWTTLHYGWRFQKEHLLTSHGVIPALYELVSYLCAPDEKVLILTPSYAFFKYAAEHNNVGLVYSDLLVRDGHYTIDFEDFENKAKDEKVTLCIFCNPHNPTGRVWTPDELKAAGEICLRHHVHIVSDEIHCDILRNGQVHTPFAKIFPESDHIVTCMAPSKTFNMAGLMFSNIIIPNDTLRSKWKMKHYDFENPLSIAAAQAAYMKGGAWLSQLKDYLDENFIFTDQYLKKHLPRAVYRVPEATYLAWIDIGSYCPKDSNLPLFFADNAGVLLEGGDMFVHNSDTHIRLNLACPRSVLEEGLKRICSALTRFDTQ